MAKAVIEHFEFVDIDKEDRKFEIPMAARNGNRALQTIEQKSAVGKIGQPIIESLVLEQIFGPFPIRRISALKMRLRRDY